MKSKRPKCKPLSLLNLFVLVSVLPTNAAFALEGKALLEKVVGELPEGVKFSWKEVTEQSPDSFTLQEVSYSSSHSPRATIEKMSFQGLRETDDGFLTVDGLSLNQLSAKSNKENGESGTVQAASATKLKLPVELLAGVFTPEIQKKRVQFGAFSINNAQVSGGGIKRSFDELKMINGDVPLDYRYSETATTDRPAAAPLTFDSFVLSNAKGDQKQSTWSLASFKLEKARIPTDINANFEDFMRLYSSFSMKGFSASSAGKELIKVASFFGTIDETDTPNTIKTNSTLEGLVVDLKHLPDPKSKEIAAQLNYDKIEASINGGGTYNPDSGRMTVDDMSMKLKDMADLSLNYVVTGYTTQVAQALSKTQLAIAKGTPPAAAYAPHLSTFSKVLLENFRLNLTDKSLTGRLLDFQGKQMGMTGDQLAQGAPMFVGMGMANLQMPEFTDMVTKAVGKFLRDKGTLTVETKLENPISLLKLFNAGQADPKTIPNMLNLEVSAQ